MDGAAPIVSVIVPCYNQGAYLEEAIDSVFAQTLQAFEIIVINDGSTEPETIERLNQFEKPKTRIIHTPNQGTSMARNTGIQAARGRYIFPLDADDRIDPSYLEKAVAILDRDEKIGIVCCEAEFFGDRTGKSEIPSYRFPDILVGNQIYNSSLYRKTDWKSVDGYRTNMVHGLEDYDFWLSIISLGRDVAQIPEVLLFYRQTAGSRNKQATQHHLVECHAQVYRNHADLYFKHIEGVFQHIFDLRERFKHAEEGIAYTRIEAAHIQAKLEGSEYHLLQVTTQLSQTQDKLQQTQAHLDAIRTALEAKLHQSETELTQTQAQLTQTQAQLAHAQAQLTQAHTRIQYIERSRFWKLREAWWRLKAAIGLVKNDESH